MTRPKLRHFLSCDDAQIHQGKISAIGLFDCIISAIFPAVHRRLVLIFAFESGQPLQSKIQIGLLGPQGEKVLEFPGPDLQHPGNHGVVSQVIELQNIHFPKPGIYLLQLFLDGDILGQQTLTVQEPPRPKIETAEQLKALLENPDIISTAYSELRCPNCQTSFRFQTNLDPLQKLDDGCLPPPGSKLFLCGTCGNKIPCENLSQNMRRLLGLHRSWLPVPQQSQPQQNDQKTGTLPQELLLPPSPQNESQ